jgi:hypothetical protein
MQTRRVQLLIVFAVVFLMRLPFLNQAVQGDDVYYLYGAEHALIEPLHPLHAEYMFMGKLVSMRGHPHGPFNSWFLALLLAIFGRVREIPFHLAYEGFSLIAALSAFQIASRFTDRALEATLLFLAVPPFFVSGNSLEADLPFLAFWLASIAFYLYGWTFSATLAATLAALTSYQGVLLAPLLFVTPSARRRWLPILAAPATIAAFQLFERYSSGALPAAVFTGYMQSYGLQSLKRKLASSMALCGHLAVNIVCPMIWLGYRRAWSNGRFLLLWVGGFFAAAHVLFFAGSARYLLPMALPVCILASGSRFLWPALAIEGVLAAGLATENMQHWNAYRDIAARVPVARRVFVNGEWGIRHYLEERGARPFEIGQEFRLGDIVVSLATAPSIDTAKTLLFEQTVTSPIPLRIVGLDSHSGFSTAAQGLLPFSISAGPIDRVRVEQILESEPTLGYLKIGTPEAVAHLISGVSNSDRWTFERGLIALKRPAGKAVLRAVFYLPPGGEHREVRLTIDGAEVAAKLYDEAGIFTLESPPMDRGPGRVTIGISTDRPFQVPTDGRALGVVLTDIGFVQ